MIWKSAILLAVISLTACGSGNNSSVGSPKQTPDSAITAAPATSSPQSTEVVKVSDFMINPKLVALKAGSTITIKNDGPTPHDLSIRDPNGRTVLKTATLKPGESKTLELALPAGTYSTYCSLPVHESLGMQGSLVLS